MNARQGTLIWLVGLCVAVAVTANLGAQIRNDQLYRSITEGQTDQLILSLDSGASPDELLLLPDSDRVISLFELSIRAENDDAAVVLLERGVEPRLEGQLGDRPLLDIVAQQGLVRTLRVLMARNPAEARAAWAEALLTALHYGRGDAARVLLETMSSEVPSDEVQSALNSGFLLAIGAQIDGGTLQELLDAGADPETTFALVAATARCSVATVELMLAAGVDPNTTYEGRHVAEVALACFDSDEEADNRQALTLVKLLYDAGSDVCTYAADQAVTTRSVRLALQDADICPEWLW